MLGDDLNDGQLLQQQKVSRTLRASSPQLKQRTLLNFLVDHTKTRHSSERIHSEVLQTGSTVALNMAPTLALEVIPDVSIPTDVPIMVLDSDEERATTASGTKKLFRIHFSSRGRKQ